MPLPALPAPSPAPGHQRAVQAHSDSTTSLSISCELQNPQHQAFQLKTPYIWNISCIYHSLGKMFGNCWPEKMLCSAAVLHRSKAADHNISSWTVFYCEILIWWKETASPWCPAAVFLSTHQAPKSFCHPRFQGFQRPGCLQYLLWESPEQLLGKFWNAQISSFSKWNLFVFPFGKRHTSSICFWPGTLTYCNTSCTPIDSC